jgi:hypothetical protein
LVGNVSKRSVSGNPNFEPPFTSSINKIHVSAAAGFALKRPVDRVNGERKLPFRFHERGSHMSKYARTYEYISGIRWKIFTGILSVNLVLLKLLLIFTKLALLTSGLK